MAPRGLAALLAMHIRVERHVEAFERATRELGKASALELDRSADTRRGVTGVCAS
jgi:hypothetical protein